MPSDNNVTNFSMSSSVSSSVRKKAFDIDQGFEDAQAALANGDFAKAEGLCRKIVATDAKHSRSWHMLGFLALQQGRTQTARELLEKSVDLGNDNPLMFMHLGDCLLQMDGEGAIEAYRTALALDADFAGVKTRLALALERMQHTDEAHNLATTILDHDPGSLKVRSLILNGKGSYGAAFLAADLANQRQLDHMPPDSNDAKDMLERLNGYQNAITAERVARWSGPEKSASKDPVFFVGFPRSGTTLMEQILKVHPNMVAGGENDWLKMTLDAKLPNYPEGLDELSHEEIEDIRLTYWKNVKNKISDRAKNKRLIDKMPLNILYLGFIRRIFPNAKILVAIRDPRDCVLSAFMQNFQRSIYMDQFLSLKSGAQFYDAVMQLWFHDKDNLGLDTFEYRYEDLVENTRSTMEEILSFLGEDWDDKVCQHHTNMDANETIATPSALDVSKAVFTRSKNRWTNYSNELEPVSGLLQASLKALGYPLS